MARRYGDQTMLQRGMIDTLRKHELVAIGAKFATRLALPSYEACVAMQNGWIIWSIYAI